MKKKYFRKRIESESESAVSIKVDSMICKDCDYKDTGPVSVFGERNYFICEKYQNGKPDKITLNNGDCQYYKNK